MRIKPHVPLFDILMNFIIDLTVDGPAEEKHFDAACAVGSGYSESKWVCEQLLATAAERTPLKPIVVRIGQMTGSSTNGYWNPKEWAPTLFRSSASIGYLPSVAGVRNPF